MPMEGRVMTPKAAQSSFQKNRDYISIYQHRLSYTKEHYTPFSILKHLRNVEKSVCQTLSERECLPDPEHLCNQPEQCEKSL